MEEKLHKISLFIESLTLSSLLVFIALIGGYISNYRYNNLDIGKYFINQILNIFILNILITIVIYLGKLESFKMKPMKQRIIFKYFDYDSYYYIIVIGRYLGIFFIIITLLLTIMNIYFIISFIIILYLSFFMMYLPPIFAGYSDLSIIYFRHYLKYRSLKDLRRGFDYLNKLFDDKLNEEIVNKIINKIYAKNIFQDNNYDSVINNIIIDLGTKDRIKIKQNSLIYFKNIDSEISPEVIVNEESPLSTIIGKFLKSQFMGLISISIQIIILVLKYFGITN